MGKADKEIVKSSKDDYTKVTFKPDLTRFKMSKLDKDTVSLLTRRAYDIAGCTRGVKVYLNKKQLPVRITTLATVWNENFTWNLILRFYGWWQNHKIKIRKLYANLVYIITRSRKKLGFRKIKIPTTFCPNDSEANHKI